MYTYQDFIAEQDVRAALSVAISKHKNSEIYTTAKSADEYDHQRNETIYNYIQLMFTATGLPVEDFTASNNKIASNFFHRLNTQRCTYLLGNGVSFSDNKKQTRDGDGVLVTIDTTKDTLGNKFDADLKRIGYLALIHGIAFGFWNMDRLYVFPVTEFVPLWDEETGALRAGIRFWKIDKEKPTIAILYEEDGYTKFKSGPDAVLEFEITQEKRAYKTVFSVSEEGGEEVIGEENYGSLPIVPMWGSNLHQSTLIGMKEAIDSFDLIRSGFANDLSDCAQIYWILENALGMDDADLERFRERLKIQHIATVDTDNSKATPYTQDIPYSARKEYLTEIRAGIYEDFGALDVHTVAAGATNDHIDAAYQPMDEEADDFEYQVTEFIQQILNLMGIEDTPVFKRNRISNELEQTQMVLSAADHLDDETILAKLPFVTIDEVQGILAKVNAESGDRFEAVVAEDDSEGINNEEAVDIAENVKGRPLNGTQTASLIMIMDKLSSGGLSEQQAINMISTAIGISKDDARKIVRGEE